MNRGIEEIEVKEEKTLSELLKERHLTATAILIAVNNEFLYPDDIENRSLKRGDKVTLIPLIAGG